MALQLKKAERKKAKLKLGMSAPSGGGKTLGALLIAYGLMKEKYPNLSDEDLWQKIAIIDSENGSGELYSNIEKAGVRIGEYNVITLTAPFTPERYIEGIQLCYNSGLEVCIIDSTTHLWTGVGGALDKQGDIAKRTGNSYTAWRDVTPGHNRFIETMLQTDIHIIATMRSKTEYVQEKGSDGKTTVRKVGLNPIQRDGMEYEFTSFLEIDAEHNAFGSKDRTGIVDQKYFKISPTVGVDFMKWLESGVDASKPPVIISEVITSDEKAKELQIVLDELKEICGNATRVEKIVTATELNKKVGELNNGVTNFTKNTDLDATIKLKGEVIEYLESLKKA